MLLPETANAIGLRFTALEDGRTVHARQDVNFAVNLPQGLRIAAVRANAPAVINRALPGGWQLLPDR